MTRLFIHSTDPELAARMNPEVLEKILKRRLEVSKLLEEKLEAFPNMTLEIGCGHGHFLTAYAQTYTDEMCVGIDVNRGRIFKARKKADRAKVNNLLFLECDSMEFLELLPPSVLIRKTWILYPDPWPKKRHYKNRIIQQPFLEKLSRQSAAGARIYLRSDYKPYLQWSEELIDASPDWRLVDDLEWPQITTTVFQELTNHHFHSLVATLKPPE